VEVEILRTASPNPRRGAITKQNDLRPLWLQGLHLPAHNSFPDSRGQQSPCLMPDKSGDTERSRKIARQIAALAFPRERKNARRAHMHLRLSISLHSHQTNPGAERDGAVDGTHDKGVSLWGHETCDRLRLPSGTAHTNKTALESGIAAVECLFGLQAERWRLPRRAAPHSASQIVR
jgi:hypothetical protein